MKHKHKKYNTINRKKQKAMWKLLLAVSLGGVTAILSPFAVDVLYGSTHRDYFPKAIVHAEEEKTSHKSILVPRESVENQIRAIAEKRNFKWTDYLVRLAFYESTLNQFAINYNKNGTIDRGVFQWNDRAHPEVDNACAFSIECATNKTIDAINAGHQSWWVADSKARRK